MTIAARQQDAYALAQRLDEIDENFQDAFAEITARAKTRFEDRDWGKGQEDALDRLLLHPATIDREVASLERDLLGPPNKETWREVKRLFGQRVAGAPGEELRHTFFNSICRRIFGIVGKDDELEFTRHDGSPRPAKAVGAVFRRYENSRALPSLIEEILKAHAVNAPFADLEGDARRVAQRLEANLLGLDERPDIDAIDTLHALLFRNKAAYIVGRVHAGDTVMPLVLALVHPRGGVTIDAVLTHEVALSVLFSFTHSYFHAEIDDPRAAIQFLRTIMPKKPVAELYMALGHPKHGKTERYRELRGQLDVTSERFVFAPGKRGMVMLVFGLPSHDVVFKVIKDRFDAPKSTTREAVTSKYRLVFQHDRVGRLVDAQEFENFDFAVNRFDEALLSALLEEASETVHIRGDRLHIHHLYTERRVTPLDVFCGERPAAVVRDALVDYGYAIKDLAAANIFPGDIFMKNFGVTRHGRVVFYDYDELCLLEECNFRRMPPARNWEDELADEPWFSVRENDIFPEEFPRFLCLQGEFREAFMAEHADLFDVDFWHRLQGSHQNGEVVDIFPYRAEERLSPNGFEG